MKTFQSLNIKSKNLIGEKIEIVNILDKQITVTDYRVKESKYSRDGMCMTMQIIHDGVTHVIFTGSDVLRQDIEQVPKDNFPFTTTIIKVDIDQRKFFLKFT